MDDAGADGGGQAEAVAIPRIKANQVRGLREKLVKQQKHKCPLCGEELTLEDAVLDHCHSAGHVRMALHRSCNAAEGRILHWAGARSRGDDPVLFLRNLIKYWGKDFSGNPIHHTHGHKKRKRRRTRTRRKPNVK